MTETPGNSSLSEQPPVLQLFAALFMVLVVGGIFFLVLFLTGFFIFNPDIKVFNDPYYIGDRMDISFTRYLLIAQHISLFIIPGMILIYKLKSSYKKKIADFEIPPLFEIAIVIIMAFALFPVTGFTGELNSGMSLPEWLSGVEHWMREKEDTANRIMEAVMNPDGAGVIALNFVTIAILPAIGEELIFRGVFQSILTRLLRSGNLAVWITAVLFSALHLQFYGFLPRLILGLVFGYLYLWGKSLWLPVTAHFVNNAVSLAATYLQGPENFSVQSEIPMWEQLTILSVSLIAGAIILYYFRRKALSSV